MVTKGLLVEDRNGQEYLLTTEALPDWERQRLSVCRRVDGRWIPVATRQSQIIRAGLIAALLDFFSGICRILHHTDATDHAPLTGVASKPIALRKAIPTE
jgi:hypothetical protein